jgi:hypothetical protein
MGFRPTNGNGPAFNVCVSATAKEETDRVMPYCITLRSRTDTRITGWYVGSHGGWSTDHKRQRLFDQNVTHNTHAINCAASVRATQTSSKLK